MAKTSEIAATLNVSPASVSEMIKILADEGMVTYEKYRGVSLTEKGAEYAKHLHEKHNVMERFLIDVLGTDEKRAHEEACKTEHVISDESAGRLCKILGTNEKCGCGCSIHCDAPSKDLTLDSVEIGTAHVISHLKGGNADQIRKLISMGFAPEISVTVLERMDAGPLLILINGMHIALKPDLASFVYVR